MTNITHTNPLNMSLSQTPKANAMKLAPNSEPSHSLYFAFVYSPEPCILASYDVN